MNHEKSSSHIHCGFQLPRLASFIAREKIVLRVSGACGTSRMGSHFRTELGSRGLKTLSHGGIIKEYGGEDSEASVLSGQFMGTLVPTTTRALLRSKYIV